MTYPFGADGRLRLSRQQLLALELRHCDSELDPFVIADAAPPQGAAGLTEWTASFCGEAVSVGWDWYVAAPGVLAVLRPDLIRSNVMLVAEQGSDLGERTTAVHLLGLINRIDWQRPVLSLLEGSAACDLAGGARRPR